MAVGHWILVQPIVAYVTALGLVVSSVLLLKGDAQVLKIIHGIMWMALIFLMINGVILQRAFGIPVTAPMIFGITGAGMLIISLLDAFIKGYLKASQIEIQENA